MSSKMRRRVGNILNTLETVMEWIIIAVLHAGFWVGWALIQSYSKQWVIYQGVTTDEWVLQCLHVLLSLLTMALIILFSYQELMTAYIRAQKEIEQEKISDNNEHHPH